MIETVLQGVSFALYRLEGVEPPASTWELLIIDTLVDGNGQPVPGSGTNQVFKILFDESSVAMLHKQSEGASPVARVAPSLVVPRGKPRR
jgi:hypothetical protein